MFNHILIIALWYGKIANYRVAVETSKIGQQEKLQNRAARIITGDNWEIRSKDVLNKLNWLPLNQRRLTDTLLFMRKIFKDEVPISIFDQLYLLG